MKNKNTIRVGDTVRIVDPQVVYRFGYPLNTNLIKKQFTDEENKSIRRFVDKFMGINYDDPNMDLVLLGNESIYEEMSINKIKDALAYIRLKQLNHGGKIRSLYTKDMPEIKTAVATVKSRKVVKTGTRVPPSGSFDYWGEYDFESGYLEDEKTHVLFELYDLRIEEQYGHKKWLHLTNDDYEVRIEDFFTGSIVTKWKPWWIEKTNLEKIHEN